MLTFAVFDVCTLLKHLVNSLAELGTLGVAFIRFRDNLDLSTPSGRLMPQIIGARAGFERALIQERVRAGLRNARAKGERLGRPRVIVNAAKIAGLRSQGASWATIKGELGSARVRRRGQLRACPKSMELRTLQVIETATCESSYFYCPQIGI